MPKTLPRAKREQSAQLAKACEAGGDMKESKARALLDDLTTDGDQIYSDKIKFFGDNLLFLTRRYDIDIPYSQFNILNGW